MHDIQEIEALRSPKNQADPFIPYHFLNERELGADGKIRNVNTIFLTNSECPFRCLMCDLWKNTLDRPTPAGAIPAQIDFALARLPEAEVIKLYNSGNFFDKKAIPHEEYETIAAKIGHFERVVVENHPKLCNHACAEFNAMVDGKLEIALGLETIHPEVLPKLNKQITVEDYKRAASFLVFNNIAIRTFILLNPPYLLDEKANIEWAIKSLRFAFDNGAASCSLIPTRTGNGIMDKLQDQGAFIPPTLYAIEEVTETALNMGMGHVFIDLWDLERFSSCDSCFETRKHRLEKMNFQQAILPRVVCNCNN